MLVLSLKVGEEVLIGPDGEIVVKLIGHRGDTARLGFKAEKTCPIHRAKVFREIHADGRIHRIRRNPDRRP